MKTSTLTKRKKQTPLPAKAKPQPEPNYDYSEYTRQETPVNQLKVLADLAEEQRRLEVAIEQAEGNVKKLQEQHRAISEQRLPELMEELNLKEFKTRSGLVIKLADELFASIPKDRAVACFDWLDKNNFSKLIKRAFIIRFGKEEEKWANKFAADLRKRKKAVNLEEKKEVHPQTLRKFVREEMENGREFPTDLFGVHRQTVAKVEVPK